MNIEIKNNLESEVREINTGTRELLDENKRGVSLLSTIYRAFFD